MQKIWYGSHNNQVQFSDNETTLTSQGINNPQSFEVDGEITGLNLQTGNETSQSQSGQQTA